MQDKQKRPSVSGYQLIDDDHPDIIDMQENQFSRHLESEMIETPIVYILKLI